MPKGRFYRILTGFLVILLAAIFLTYAAVISWALRDGLGPGVPNIDSEGLVAWQRFLKNFGPMCLIASLFGLSGLWLVSPIFIKNSPKK
jgi:hypothetical protein